MRSVMLLLFSLGLGCFGMFWDCAVALLPGVAGGGLMSGGRIVFGG